MKHTLGGVPSLRGFACVMLVFYHVVGSSEYQGLKIHDGWIRYATEALVAVRMPVFGLIAGAMFALGTKSGFALVQEKFKRLVIPMLIVGTLFALIQSVVPGSNAKVTDWHLIHIVPVAHYWFIESLFMIFCFMAVTQVVWPANTPTRWLAYMSLSIVAYLMHPGIIWLGLEGAIYLMPYFLLGLGMVRFRWDQGNAQIWQGASFILCGGLLVADMLTSQGFLHRFGAPTLLAGLLLSAGLWLLKFRSEAFHLIGGYAFSIYLFHVFFTSATRMALQAMGCESLPIHLVTGTVAGLVGPIWLHQWGIQFGLFRKYILSIHSTKRSALGRC
jgi:surface polysaccharide O-acyltransferase-like enzyme